MNNKTKYTYCGIYKIQIGGYNYIGQSQDIKTRISKHKKQLITNKHCNNYMQNVFNKYKTFEYKILFKCEKEFLTILEQVCINYYSKNNLNLAPAGKYFTEEHKQNLSKANRVSKKNRLGLLKAQAALKGLPKTEVQLQSSRKTVKTMNTPEANLKSKMSRQNNINVIKANRKRLDPTIYIFVNKKTELEFKGTREVFKQYLSNLGVPNVCGRVAEILKGKSFRGWILKSGQEVTFKSAFKQNRTKGITSTSSDRTIYSFLHTKTNKVFIGTRYEFSELIGTTSKQLSGLITLKDKTYYKWKLNSCSLKKSLPK